MSQEKKVGATSSSPLGVSPVSPKFPLVAIYKRHVRARAGSTRASPSGFVRRWPDQARGPTALHPGGLGSSALTFVLVRARLVSKRFGDHPRGCLADGPAATAVQRTADTGADPIPHFLPTSGQRLLRERSEYSPSHRKFFCQGKKSYNKDYRPSRELPGSWTARVAISIQKPAAAA